MLFSHVPPKTMTIEQAHPCGVLYFIVSFAQLPLAPLSTPAGLVFTSPLPQRELHAKVKKSEHDDEKLQSFIDGPQEPFNRLQHQWTKENGAYLGPIWKALARVTTPGSSPQPTTSTPPSLAANGTRQTGTPRFNYAPVAEPSDQGAISATRPSLPTEEESFKQPVDEKGLQSENHVVTLARAVIDQILAYSQALVANKGLEFREEETRQVGKP
ncbi:hypothetical protein FIE12Z_12131 [Fusarium flagelliforme]|uniref:Uncharacterized protein n=1 Tax=Fusarium flagelliforme TaxID=2675880 RepID=A0A395M6Z4_9HYPO|nr:hypothetical protein FIE12Z_12131 [Fusarium flagelliforme]